MATVHGVLGVRLEDTEGVITSHQIFVQFADTATLATLISAAQAYFALLDPITDAAGITAHLIANFDSTGLKTAPIVKNPVGNGGLFTFQASGTPYVYSSLVPSIAESKLTGGKLNITDTDVVDYYQWFTAPPGALTPTTKGYQVITAFRTFKLSTRKHRREQTRVSEETP
jgi:hypothetical protein